ncbi:FAD-dependent oxidoreductase [Nocardia sp. NPDC051030]|uniref:FAD-dependent oxidoreductase n=1 Tax=Nocardia sp. NPDC051030 TaxID=3155162 RepID=UPI00342A55D0
MRIAIIGAGIAGLTTAAALQGQGHSIAIFEKARRLQPVGAGFTLQPNGVSRLSRLGLSDAIRSVGSPVDRSFVCDSQGREIPVDIMHRLSGNGTSYAIHRADFQSILLSALDGVEIHTDRRFESYHEEDDSVVVRFGDGQTERADLVIGADGSKSVMQAALGNEASPVGENIMAYRALVPVEQIDWAAMEPRMGIWLGEGKTLLCYRVSSGTLMNIAAYVPADRNTAESWSAPGSTDELVSIFSGWEPRVVDTLARVSDSFKWGIYDRPALTTWCSRSVALVGDAAHAMVPHLGQGANQAIQDAFALAECLVEADRSNLEERLRTYEQVRKARAEFIQRLSRDAGQLYRNYSNDDAHRKAAAIIDFLHTSGLGEHDAVAAAREQIALRHLQTAGRR